MTNRRTTKQLLVSVVLLIVCILMLLGTTFAWFTDNATSPDNKVEAGTLDVQLCMYNGTEYENIGDSAKPIFGKANSLVAQNDAQDTLWEPGKTQVVYLKIVNNGSLDLKYKVSIDVKDNADDKDLYKALEYAIDVGVDSTMAAPLWDGGKKVIPGNNVDTTDVELPAKEEGSTAHEHYFTLSVHMLEEAGNVYQGGYVEFDIKVAATQLNSEEGSFGSDYDKDATYPEVDTLVIPEAGTSPVDIVDYDEVADQVDTKITLPAGSAAGTYTLAVSNENVVTDAEGNTVSSFDIELTVNGEKVPAGTYVVEKYVGEYLNDVKVTHNGEPVAVDAYDPTTGYVTFTVDSFSPFAVSYYSGVINTVEDLANIAKGGNFILMSDIELAAAIVIPAGVEVTLDLNGKTVSAATSAAMLVNNGTLTIVGGTIENTAVNGGATISNNGTLVLDGANVVGAPIGKDSGYPAYCISNSGNLTVEEGTTVSADRGCLYLSGTGETVINGGTFTNNDIYEKLNGRSFTSHVVVVGYGANNKLTINGGSFNHFHTTTSGGVVINNWSAVTVDVNGGNFSGGNYYGKWDNLSDYGYGSTKTPFAVKGGTFTGMDSNYVADGYEAKANADGTYTVAMKEGTLNDLFINVEDKGTVTLPQGTYTIPSAVAGKTVTIEGVGDNTVIDFTKVNSVDGASITFKNLHIQGKNENVMNGFGIQGTTEHITYENCTFDGAVTNEYFGSVSYINCTFTGTGYITTYAVKSAEFVNCTFDKADSRAVLVYSHGNNPCEVTLTDCTFKAAAKATTWAGDWTAAIEVDTTNIPSAGTSVTINNCTYDENYSNIVRDKSAEGKANAVITVDGKTLLTSANIKAVTLTSNTGYMLTGDFGGQNVSLVMPVGVENVIFDGSKATNINELIITQNGELIDNANTPVGERSGNVTVQNFNVLSQINVFACKTEVVVQKNTAEALMIYAGNCDVKVLNNTIDANFESHPTYRNATQTWNTNNYGIALNIFDYNLWLDGNTVTDATGHAIGINGWETTIDNGDENVIESFKGNTITVNSTSKTKRAAFKVWDDETYASNDDDTNVVNATTQAFIDAVLADGSNTFNIIEGYDHTIFSIYNVNTNN